MPVYQASYMLPQSEARTWLLEDKYIKGGCIVVADSLERDNLPIGNKKVGMLVATSDSGKLWMLQADLTTWNEFTSSSLIDLTTQTTISGILAGNGSNIILAVKGVDYAATRTGVVRNEFIPIGSALPRLSNGPNFGTYETPVNKVSYDYADFVYTAISYVCFNWIIPKAWNGGTLKAEFVWINASTSLGTVVWGIQALAVGDNTDIDSPYGATEVISDATISSYSPTKVFISGQTGPITVANAAVGRLIQFQVYRELVGNTLNGTARLLGIFLEYTEAEAEPTPW